jgi:hypothetical protein
MSHQFELLLRGARAAGFTDGLRAGRRSVEKKLMDLQKYVGQLEGQLHKEGNWRTTRVSNGTTTRSHDRENPGKRAVNTVQVQRCTPSHPASRAVTFTEPTPVPTASISTASTNIEHFHTNHSSPWASISRRRGRHFRSRIHSSKPDSHSQVTDYTRYTIPPLRPTFVTDFVSSSLAFPVRLFSRIWDRDEGVAMRDGGTCGSGLRVPGILGGVRGPGSI